jgi:L-ascorbate metabolism protein UlaG (beta-lactamase superfamily)
MTTAVLFHGHSSFEIKTGGQSILIDPFLTGNPAADVSADELNPDFIVISHAHGDHIGDMVSIAQRTGALSIANFEIVEWMKTQGLENVHPQHIGGAHAYDFGTLKLTIAHHGSSFPDGTYGGNPCGLLFKLNGCTIYHAADTGLFGDMQLIGDEGVDVAILPIGDNFTMGPDDSIRAINLIRPKKVIPCHYNTWPLIAQDDAAWAASVKEKTQAEPVVLQPGESAIV